MEQGLLTVAASMRASVATLIALTNQAAYMYSSIYSYTLESEDTDLPLVLFRLRDGKPLGPFSKQHNTELFKIINFVEKIEN